jgi:single-stranded DNA-specific DHH superfamily exonuclease
MWDVWMGFLKKLKEKVGLTDESSEQGAEAERNVVVASDAGSSVKDTINEVKSEQSLLSKIQDILMFGKGTREDLKEFDMQLREDYHKELQDIRQRWETVYLEILDSQPSLNRRFKTIIQTLDRIKEQVNRATYGYAPLFNRTGQIGSDELARVFNYDKQFGEYLNHLRVSEDNVISCVGSKDWVAVSVGLDNMKAVISDTERRWKEREKYFKSKEI